MMLTIPPEVGVNGVVAIRRSCMVETRQGQWVLTEDDADSRRLRVRKLSEHVLQAPPLQFERYIRLAELPLEVLAACYRGALRRQESPRGKQLLESILKRIQPSNELWVRTVMFRLHIPLGERSQWAADLLAELTEQVIRALKDPERCSWQEHFQYSLFYARKHVYTAFLRKEGLGVEARVGKGTRVPRQLLVRLDSLRFQQLSEQGEDYIDERAQDMLSEVEESDLGWLVLNLPEKLKAVILLSFWDGKSFRDIAALLHISERTVRNRIQAGLERLRRLLP